MAKRPFRLRGGRGVAPEHIAHQAHVPLGGELAVVDR